MISTKGWLTRLPEGIDSDDFDFDHPNSLDFTGMYKCLSELIEGEETKTPVYCFKTHKRLPGQYNLLKTKEIIIFEGILCMHDERIRKLFNLKIFIHCDPDIALARRIRRDINERGRDVTEVLKRYNRFVKKDFDKYVKPQMKYVDFTIPGGANNDIAMDILVQNLKSRLTVPIKRPSALSVDDQLKSLLCMDISKLASPAQIQCPTSSQKHLINSYLGLTQADDLDYIKSNVETLIALLTKNTLGMVNTDLNENISTLSSPDNMVCCRGASNRTSPTDNEKMRFVHFLETTCSDKAVDTIIDLRKRHKGVPIYCSFVFIEENTIQKLFKEVDLLKMVCLYPLFSASEIDHIRTSCPGSFSLDKIGEVGDQIIVEKLRLENK